MPRMSKSIKTEIRLAAVKSRGKGEYKTAANGTGFLSGVIKMFRIYKVVMVTQHCECTKSP